MSKEYETQSFYLACFLATEGMQLLRVDRPFNSKRAAFVFMDSSCREQLVKNFMIEEELLVSVKNFISQIRRLKSALYDGEF